MKNLFFALAFTLVGTFAFANEKPNESLNSETYLEFTTVVNENGEDTCYARFCWNVSETQRRCTDWQEISCNTEIEVEVKKKPEEIQQPTNG